MKPIILSTEDLNRYGYWILTSGIILSAFKKNPIMLYDHRSYSMMPIGKIENLRVENSKLIGDPVFDEDDPDALKAKKKYEKGMLNAASIGISIKEWSDKAQHIKKGQRRPTVTRCELREVSITPIPANPNAVKLHLEDGQSLDTLLPQIKLSNNKTMEQDFKNIAAKLGLSEDATELQILQTIEKLNADSARLSENEVNALINDGKAKGLINDDNESALRELAAANLESVKSLVGKMKAPQKKGEKPEPKLITNILGDRTNLSTQDTDERAKWTFDDWSKNDPDGLLNIKNNEPEKYKQLALTYKPA